MQIRMARMAKPATPRPIPNPVLEGLEALEALEGEAMGAIVVAGSVVYVVYVVCVVCASPTEVVGEVEDVEGVEKEFGEGCGSDAESEVVGGGWSVLPAEPLSGCGEFFAVPGADGEETVVEVSVVIDSEGGARACTVRTRHNAIRI